ncbi:SDR family oxidoreductase [Solimonas sp. SE-A11]|uniref:SDR family oxidoreductase n=1 Tax=Solimonas sp. SE-A11 TaxID=3054954 RepID=UPI00259CC1E2|nr:SDR family oxidoreductase [Solimonas sp. SE-A11]MDM4771269.1 SDR family oxidoreductase [Solimonas sp. SE-A11]
MSRTVLITGGNSGIGYEMALALAKGGNRIIIAARDEAKSAAAVEKIKAASPGAQIAAVKLDLADFAQIDRFADYLLKRVPTIDVLILNAGMYTTKLQTLPSGYEAMIGVMHFGHFRLAQRLLDAVVAAPQGRIIVTSSMMHKLGRIDARSFTKPSKHLTSMHAYGQAKLANLLFVRELALRLKNTRVTVNAFHPGAVATDIYRQLPAPLARLMKAFMLTPQQGADTAVWMATDDKFRTVTGKYYVNRSRRHGSSTSRDMDVAARLWRLSEKAMKAT